MVAYTVFQQMASMFLIIAAAYVMSKAGLINSQISKGLSAILTTLGSPALVIRAMQIPCTRENIKVLGLAYGGMFFIVCIGIACGILFLFTITPGVTPRYILFSALSRSVWRFHHFSSVVAVGLFRSKKSWHPQVPSRVKAVKKYISLVFILL